MHKLETITLGEYRGDTYIITGFVEPKPTDSGGFDPIRDARNYGVSLARLTADHRTNVEIVVVDTAHGHAHMDLRYLPRQSPRARKHPVPDWSYQEMRAYLVANWKRYIDSALKYDI